MSYPKRGLSIDIGNDKIKIIEYKRSGDKVKIRKSLLIDTPEQCLDDGSIIQMELLSACLMDALKENNIKEKKVLFSIASNKIITREVELPDLPKKKLDSLIKMNAEEYFPVDLAEYTTDYRVLDHYVEGEDKMIRVNMVAAFTDLMERYIHLSDLLNLKLVGVDFAGNSIVNYAMQLNKTGTYMLLDLGSKSTMVTIISDNSVRFNRNLVYGTNVVISSIQNHFNVRYKEAVKISAEQTLLDSSKGSDDLLGSDVSGALNQLLSGVSRLVDFYTSRNKDSIEKIYLVGGGTKVNGIIDYIAEYFNIPTETIDGLNSVTSEDELYNVESVFYATAIGAIYSEMNLLPQAFINRDKQKAQNRLRLELALLVVLLTGVAMYMPYMTIQRLEKEKTVLLNEIDEKKVVEPVKAEYDLAMKGQNFYTSIENSSGSTTEVLLAIIEKMEMEIPTDIDYLSLDNSEEGLLISCVAKDKGTLIQFISILKAMEINELPVFERVYVPSYTNPELDTTLSADKEGYYTFSIICDYSKGAQ